MSATEFVGALVKVCDKEDLKSFESLWEQVHDRRGKGKYDAFLLEDGVMKWLKFAFRHKDSAWRVAGINVARSFFHITAAKEKLVTLDFIGSVLLITLPEGQEEG